MNETKRNEAYRILEKKHQSRNAQIILHVIYLENVNI